jgi:nitroreductase
MNETLQTLKNRYSTKKYTDRQVPDELLDAILEAGLYAPTGLNNQQVYMVAVRDKETRDLLAELNTSIRGATADMFYGAPCVIVVLANPENGTWVEDGSVVLCNLLNAATSLGVSSCWIHRARETFDLPEGKALLKKWGLPESLRGVGNCILGYGAGEPQRKPRKDGRILKID